MALPISTAQKMPGHYGDKKKMSGKKSSKKSMPASLMKNTKKKTKK